MRVQKITAFLIFTALILSCSKKPKPVVVTKTEPVTPVVNSIPKPLPPLPKTPAEIFEEADYLAYIIVESVVKPDPDQKDAKPVYSRNFGSGVVIQYENDWYVLTAGHMYPTIGEVDHVWIRLKQPENSHKLIEVEFVAHDDFMDIAILKFKEKFVYTGTRILYGDSDKLKPGETVVALGAPYKIPECVSVGRVIKPMIGITEGANHPGLILHDTSLNGGNSGGPLLNLYGELVGINIQVRNMQPGYPTSNSVPINDIRPMIHALLAIKTGLIHLLVYLQVQNSWDLTPGQLGRLGIDAPQQRGLIITAIPGIFSKTYEELKIGDVILEVNGQKITDADHFYHDTLTDVGLPDSVELLIQRKDKTLKLKAPLLPY